MDITQNYTKTTADLYLDIKNLREKLQILKEILKEKLKNFQRKPITYINPTIITLKPQPQVKQQVKQQVQLQKQPQEQPQVQLQAQPQVQPQVQLQAQLQAQPQVQVKKISFVNRVRTLMFGENTSYEVSLTNYNKFFSYKKNQRLFEYTFTSNFNDFKTFIDDSLSTLITPLLGSQQSDDIKLEFFKKSLALFFLKATYPTDNYLFKDSNQGLLIKSSTNCLHRILPVYSLSPRNNSDNFFVKVVPYNTKENDLVIFDVLNGIYLNTIIESYPYYKKHISKFFYSFLSYYYEMTLDMNFWAINTLTYNTDNDDYSKSHVPSNIYSPYNPRKENLEFKKLLVDSLEELSVSKYKEAYIFISEAIDHISIYHLFSDIVHNLSMIESIFKEKFSEFFKFLLFLGITYGFHHSDLHASNLIFNKRENSIAMIDLGRSCFGILLHRENASINSMLQEEVEKLNYKNNPDIDIKTAFTSGTSGTLTYKYLYDYKADYNSRTRRMLRRKYELILNKCKIKIYTPPASSNIYYPMILFDLAQLSLIMYNNLLKFLGHLILSLNKRNKELISKFKINVDTILNFDITTNNYYINNNSLDLRSLFENYQNFNKKYLPTISSSEDILFEYKESIKIIVDGLLIVALILLSHSTTNNDERILDTSLHCYFQILEIKQRTIINILNIFKQFYTYFHSNNHYLINIMSNNTSYVPLPATSGGNKKKNIKIKAGREESTSINPVLPDLGKIQIGKVIQEEGIQEEGIQEEGIQKEIFINLEKAYTLTYKEKERIKEQQIEQIEQIEQIKEKELLNISNDIIKQFDNYIEDENNLINEIIKINEKK